MAELDYDLVKAIEALTSILEGFDETDMDMDWVKNNPYISDIINENNKLYRKNYDALYTLCRIVVKQGIIDTIRQELKDDDFDTWYFDDIIDEIDYFAKEKAHEEVMYDVEVGDKVKLYNGNIRYVNDIDGNTLWVTPSRDTDRGWSAQLSDVVEILEKYNEG